MPLMAGKQGLIMGVANERSLAWGIAKALHGQGAAARLHLSGRGARQAGAPARRQHGQRLRRRMRRRRRAEPRRVFAAIGERWGRLDFAVHAIGSTDPNALRGKYVDTTRENFARTLDISCFSFTESAGARRR